jgi:hypothetical protein
MQEDDVRFVACFQWHQLQKLVIEFLHIARCCSSD